MVEVEIFSEGKAPGMNEDRAAYSGTSFVVADGATDKSGRLRDGMTGGEVTADLVAQLCINTDLNGSELVEMLNGEVRKLYDDTDTADADKGVRRFTCGFVLCRLAGDKIVITKVGDVGFRINGKNLYREKNAVDVMTAAKRAEYITRTGDVTAAREHIMPDLRAQYRYQNDGGHELGYGAIDGTTTPDKFIKVFEYDRKEVATVELFTDGYFEIPTEAAIDAWENTHKRVEEEDPDKYLKYKSTKSKDDRTVMIIRL